MRLLAAVITSEDCFSATDARFFAPVSSLDPAALETTVRKALGSAERVSIPSCEPHRLLDLPPLLSSLSKGIVLLKAG
jgi:hypothetical protein